ncbi:hypothetical protein ACXJY6_07310 [Vibrio sp. RC27]
MLQLDAVFALLPPMLFGTLVLLTLILEKGDICPGQRGRIHKTLPVIAIGWGISGITMLPSLAVGALLLIYFSQVKTGKTRGSGPIKLLFGVNVLAGLLFVMQLVSSGQWLMMVSLVLFVILLGASLGHLLLVIARTRLQAFHKLLPCAGVVAAMCLSLCLIPLGTSLSEQELEQATPSILFAFIVMIISIVVWIWPIIRSTTPTKWPLVVSLGLLLTSASAIITLISH